MTFLTIKVGDTVVALSSPRGQPSPDAMRGEVVKVMPPPNGLSLSGGNRVMLRVRWSNGHEGRMEERMVRRVEA